MSLTNKPFLYKDVPILLNFTRAIVSTELHDHKRQLNLSLEV